MILSSGLTCIIVLFLFLNCICIISVSWGFLFLFFCLFFNLAFVIISWIVSCLDYSWITTTGTSSH